MAAISRPAGLWETLFFLHLDKFFAEPVAERDIVQFQARNWQKMGSMLLN